MFFFLFFFSQLYREPELQLLHIFGGFKIKIIAGGSWLKRKTAQHLVKWRALETVDRYTEHPALKTNSQEFLERSLGLLL